jgi:hypothetical protein
MTLATHLAAFVSGAVSAVVVLLIWARADAAYVAGPCLWCGDDNPARLHRCNINKMPEVAQ